MCLCLGTCSGEEVGRRDLGRDVVCATEAAVRSDDGLGFVIRFLLSARFLFLLSGWMASPLAIKESIASSRYSPRWMVLANSTDHVMA